MDAFSRLCLTVLFGSLAIISAGRIAAAQQTPPATSPTVSNQQDNAAKPHQPKPNPDASGKYHIGDGVTPPVLVHSVEPEFAKKMHNINRQQCIVALTVGSDGKPTDVHIAPALSASKNQDNGDLAIETRMICPMLSNNIDSNQPSFKENPLQST